MKIYRLVKQEKRNYGVPSVLQAILNYNGINIPQTEIATNLTLGERGGILVDDRAITDFLRKKGFEYLYYPHNATPFNEPDAILRDMDEHQGILGIKPFIYILTEFRDPSIEVIEPIEGRSLSLDLYQTLKDMNERTGFFGLVKRLH